MGCPNLQHQNKRREEKRRDEMLSSIHVSHYQGLAILKIYFDELVLKLIN